MGSGSAAAELGPILGAGEAGSRAAFPDLAGTGSWGQGCEPGASGEMPADAGGECAPLARSWVCAGPQWREAGGRGPAEPRGRAVRARDLWEGGVAA